MADKFVILRFEQGNFDQGFSLTLQVGADGTRPSTAMTGSLPSAQHLPQHYRNWKIAYERLGLPSRIKPVPDQVTNISYLEDCFQAAATLHQSLNDWLCTSEFRPTREKLLEQLSPCDRTRLILQTNNLQIQKLPWHSWDLLERYPLTEIALAAPTYTNVTPQHKHETGTVRILAILGNSDNIDVSADQALLSQLPNAYIQFLDEPDRRQLSDQLWEQHWDILFFAGHSHSHGSTSGTLCLNDQDNLDIEELRYALRKAVDHGLQLAILNSCDGLGLGRTLADLQIPQLVVMREPVPDPVAQEFLKYFLQTYAKGATLYLAMREARERLQSFEKNYPCATWLPVICQNPAVVPPTWSELLSSIPSPTLFDWATNDRRTSSEPPKPKPQPTKTPTSKPKNLISVLRTSLFMTVVIMAGRLIGLLQPSELWALDQLMQRRPLEQPDTRFLMITVSEAEIQAQGEDSRRSSLSDSKLSQLLTALEEYQPRVIGLDIYRDFPVSANQPRLLKQLQTTKGLVGICKHPDASNDSIGISPPPEMANEQIGFSDFVGDPDGILRRQLLYLTPAPASPCTTNYAFSSILAFYYLDHLNIQPTFTADSQLKLGKAILPKLQPRMGGYQTIDTGGIQLPLNYRSLKSPRDIAPHVTLTEVIEGRVNTSRIKNKIVLIGISASSSSDDWATPYGASGSGKVPGVFIQAQMTSQLLSKVLDKRPLLWAWSQWGDAIWILCWSTAGGLLIWQLSNSKHLAIVGIVTLLALIGSCLLMLIQGLWLPLVPTLVASLATSVTVAYTKHINQISSVGKFEQ